eukprot:6187956-Pleurochrysis_carterae.AAC.2
MGMEGTLTRRVDFKTPPCEAPGDEHQRATFIIVSRIAKNTRGGSGFVKKSAKLSALATKGTRDVGSAVVSPRSWKSERKYTASFVASDAAMISASHEESATEEYVTQSGVAGSPVGVRIPVYGYVAARKTKPHRAMVR